MRLIPALTLVTFLVNGVFAVRPASIPQPITDSKSSTLASCHHRLAIMFVHAVLLSTTCIIFQDFFVTISHYGRSMHLLYSCCGVDTAYA